MREKPLMTPRLPENASRTPCGQNPQEVGKVIGAFESLRRKVEDSRNKKISAAEFHKEAAPVAEAILDGYGKDLAASSAIGDTKQTVSDMRYGLRGMSLWQLVRIFDESPEAFVEFCRPFCARHGMQLPQREQRVSREEVIGVIVRSVLDSPPLLRMLVGDAAQEFGVTRDEVLAALAK